MTAVKKYSHNEYSVKDIFLKKWLLKVFEELKKFLKTSNYISKEMSCTNTKMQTGRLEKKKKTNISWTYKI